MFWHLVFDTNDNTVSNHASMVPIVPGLCIARQNCNSHSYISTCHIFQSKCLCTLRWLRTASAKPARGVHAILLTSMEDKYCHERDSHHHNSQGAHHKSQHGLQPISIFHKHLQPSTKTVVSTTLCDHYICKTSIHNKHEISEQFDSANVHIKLSLSEPIE